MAVLRLSILTVAVCFLLSSPNRIEAKKHLRDLPLDVLLLIFEQLYLPDLLNVAESDESLLPSTTWVFRHNHKGKTFVLDSYDCTVYIREKNETLNYEETEKLLHIFGSSIRNLNIRYSDLKQNLTEEINQLICEKCAKNVQNFGMSFGGGELHSALIPAIFSNVESVYLYGDHFGNITDSLVEKFPKVRSLALNSNNFELDELVDDHFVHLENVIMGTNTNPALFERLLQINPQIKSVIIGGSTNYLRIMHDNLPNLESLELLQLPWLDSSNETVPFYRFETVKNFTLHHDSWRNLLQNIPYAFGNLEKLELYGENSGEIQSSGFQKYVSFIEDSKNIRKLTLIHDNCPKYAYLAKLNLPQLSELKLQGIDLNAENTTEFEDFFIGISQREKAMKIYLMRYRSNTIDILNHKLSSDWKITLDSTNSQFYSRYYDYIDIIITRE